MGETEPEIQVTSLTPASLPPEIDEDINNAEEMQHFLTEDKSSLINIKQEYLDKKIMPLVLEGVSWIIKERPQDPVEHLAMFLIKNANPSQNETKASAVENNPNTVSK